MTRTIRGAVGVLGAVWILGAVFLVVRFIVWDLPSALLRVLFTRRAAH